MITDILKLEKQLLAEQAAIQQKLDSIKQFKALFVKNGHASPVANAPKKSAMKAKPAPATKAKTNNLSAPPNFNQVIRETLDKMTNEFTAMDIEKVLVQKGVPLPKQPRKCIGVVLNKLLKEKAISCVSPQGKRPNVYAMK